VKRFVHHRADHDAIAPTPAGHQFRFRRAITARKDHEPLISQCQRAPNAIEVIMSNTELRPGYCVDVRAMVMDVDGDVVTIQFEGASATIEITSRVFDVKRIISRTSDQIANCKQFQNYIARLLDKRAALAPLIKRTS
jgi:hypothetical protein